MATTEKETYDEVLSLKCGEHFDKLIPGLRRSFEAKLFENVGTVEQHREVL